MSRLYDIAKNVVNSNSIFEAEQLLFGTDGIIMNSSEYYQNIISEFKQKKEIIIKKENGKLVFDLNNCNDLYNILFLYNYYIHYIEQKIEKLNEKIQQCQDIQKTLQDKQKKLNNQDPLYPQISEKSNELSLEVNNLKDLKQTYENYKTKSLQAKVVQLENMSNVDENQLEEYIGKLKEAINFMQKMRDSLAHQNPNLHIDSIISIDNPKGEFEISIPSKYVEGFNKGRIIANEQDKIIVQQTNDISAPLLETLDFDIKKIDSFFYNIDPHYLDFILEKVNYNSQELYKLSHHVFDYPNETKMFIEKGLNIYQISLLPHNAFTKYRYADNLLKNNIDITKLPAEAFFSEETTTQLLKRKIDITQLPKSAFYSSTVTLSILDQNVDITKLPEEALNFPTAISYFLNNNVDITKLPEKAFHAPELTIMLLERKIDITKLPEVIFRDPKSAMQLIDNNIDITKLPEKAFHNPQLTVILLNNNIDISKLPKEAFCDPKNNIQLLAQHLDVDQLPIDVFSYNERIIYKEISNINPSQKVTICDPTIIPKLLEKNIDITKIPEMALQKPELILKIIEENIDVTQLPEEAFFWPQTTIKFLKQEIDITKLPEKAFYYPELVMKFIEENIDATKIPIKIYQTPIEIENIKYILDKVNYDYTRLDEFPIEFFTCQNKMLLDNMLQKYNSNLSKSIFGINNPKIIATLLYANEVLSNYNKNISTTDMNIHPYSIILNTYMDNFNYRKNIEENIGKSFASQDFIEQFKLTDENDFTRSNDEIRKTLLTKIRNASAHFRFKPVKDNNGQLLENKIYIYDEDNKGINNFNLIIDLEELVNIIREVEIQMECHQTINIGDKKR